MEAATSRPFQRRTTAAALKQEILDFLGEALPAGWISQPLDQGGRPAAADILVRSEEHTSELQSLMRISYAVFCLKKKKNTKHSVSRILLQNEQSRKLSQQQEH